MSRSNVWRAARALLVLAVLTVSSHSVALDRELVESPDFRVRVQAALRLGRTGGREARGDLERGLKDAHPAVRVACATSLATIGDQGAAPALEAAVRAESFPAVRTALVESLQKLKNRGGTGNGAAAGIDSARYVVQVGNMRNVSGARASDLEAVMRQAAKSKAASIKGAYVLDASDSSLLQKANAKQIPVLLVDGNLTRLTQTASKDGGVIVSAQVDLSIRRVPQQTLKGMVKGNASASDDSRAALRGLIELQNRAVGGAVESAMGSVSAEIATLAR